MGYIKNGYMMNDKTTKMIKQKFRADYIAKQVGISNAYMSMIMNKKYNCSKPVAYCITKVINSEAEIQDYFDKV